MPITLLSFFIAFLISLIAVPTIIRVAYSKDLLDDPAREARKVHQHSVPNLGGVAVFSTFALVSCLFIHGDMLANANFILAAGIIIFTVGLKDDLLALDPYKKFAAQFFTAFIIIYFADIRFTNFFGVLGIYEVGPILSYAFTSFVIVFIINAFNLIDGINGLLGSITLLISLIYGTLFYFMHEKGLCVLSFCMAGSVLGFLKYNMKQRAHIFMGDAGAYSIGFTLAILSIKFVELNHMNQGGSLRPMVNAAPAVAIAMLIIPVFDTFRVFTLRILRGRSPFMADRNHMHHRLLDVGLNHLQASGLILAVNICIILLAITVSPQVQTSELLVILTLTMLFFNMLLWVYEVRNADRIQALNLNKVIRLGNKRRLTKNLEQTEKVAVNTNLTSINTVATKEYIGGTNQPKDIEAAKRFTQEVLDNLEKSKN